MRKRIKFLLNETGKPLHIEHLGTLSIALAFVAVFLGDASILFIMLAPVFAGSGVYLWEQSDILRRRQIERERYIDLTHKEIDDD
jgi:hypothetical protein